ncbi:type II toxin-antitoxin system HicA family toxin [Yersinia ruckeri]|uniref:type II toxin-antitoxin system HicA family toxin n=1 Tax=Yersinia ruckeri TaxID=29486 RepID=UPI0004E28F65|nr:type II toxin-antitoxin system HicA family toxin [Yersinia ruckeri]ARZ02193.1 YcfA-like protein [Yersinia ruckeri]EKN3361148.1 type II toxin-antitoxin system HicA family toxin [Yersinia ruckeri]EKN4197146.1 type II toxin-antitoxin system HicA family toxin [Yersinia ruckeri]EKN4202391.1 type II toxin-antitoxin system HicA family toxin [Yersinia ruckeri]EKN4204319.1 type II toxin-antitoxin system HicA family toxin [Yersinia ruckeri]
MDSGKLMKKLQDAGWQIRGGKKNNGGSHITMIRPGVPKIITLPHPRKDISKGLLKQIQRISGITLS